MPHNMETYLSQKIQELAHLPELNSEMKYTRPGWNIDFVETAVTTLYFLVFQERKQPTFNTNLYPHTTKLESIYIGWFAYMPLHSWIRKRLCSLSFFRNANTSSFLITSLFSLANLFSAKQLIFHLWKVLTYTTFLCPPSHPIYNKIHCCLINTLTGNFLYRWLVQHLCRKVLFAFQCRKCFFEKRSGNISKLCKNIIPIWNIIK